jgi:hypothetical protein
MKYIKWAYNSEGVNVCRIMFLLQNNWKDFEEFWYKLYTKIQWEKFGFDEYVTIITQFYMNLNSLLSNFLRNWWFYKNPIPAEDVELPETYKGSVFWDLTPCNPVKVSWHFGGTCRLHFQLRRWRWHVPPKRRLTFAGLHAVLSQKIELFITTAVRTSNHT